MFVRRCGVVRAGELEEVFGCAAGPVDLVRPGALALVRVEDEAAGARDGVGHAVNAEGKLVANLENSRKTCHKAGKFTENLSQIWKIHGKLVANLENSRIHSNCQLPNCRDKICVITAYPSGGQNR